MGGVVRRALFLVIAVVWSVQLHALITIAPVEFGQKPGLSLKAALSLITKRGNSDIDLYKVASRLKYDNNASYVTWLQLQGEYAKSQGIKSVQRLYAHFRYIHTIYDRYHVYELALQTEEDAFRLIRYRRLVAAGYRHRFGVRGKHLKLYAGIGGLYESIRYLDSTLNPQESNFRLNSYLSLVYDRQKRIRTSFIGYYQPRVDDISDFALVNKLELKFKVHKRISLNLSLRYSYDAKPAVGVESRYDFSEDTTLVYEF